MPQRAVGLLFKIRPAIYRTEKVKGLVSSTLKSNSKLTHKTCTVAVCLENRGVAILYKVLSDWRSAEGIVMSAFDKPRKNGRSARRTNRSRYKCICKSSAGSGEFVDIWRFCYRVPIAAELVIALIIR